ncbi:hypothetical protein ACWCYY_23065 [Kitasatospora sp. NPDC001664]
MGDRANVIVVRESGEHELYYSKSAVDIDLDLLHGPEGLLSSLSRARRDDWWLDDLMAQAGILADFHHKVLLCFVWEGPTAELRYRQVALELIRAAWPGWEFRWLYDGATELREYLGLDPEFVRRRPSDPEEPSFMGPDDENLPDLDDWGYVVTVGTDRVHLGPADIIDHPVQYGPALLDLLAVAPTHGASRRWATSGVHLDPARRFLGWWTLGNVPRAYEVPARWPGWTAEFWQDDWQAHVRASGGLFSPAPFDPDEARAEVLERLRERR